MKLYRIRAVARKEYIHVLRDPRALAVGLLMPMILLILFGFALTLDVDHVPLLIWDQSGTVMSRDLESLFTGSRYFDLVGRADNYRDIERAIDRREALMALVIPRDYDREIASGRSAEVQLLVDGSDANTAQLAMGYADAVVRAADMSVKLAVVARRGQEPPRAAVDARTRIWYNDDIESRNAIVPGLIAVIMMVIAALLTSLTVAREWETGTMEQLISTPLTPGELITGKMMPYLTISVIDLVVSVLMGRYVLDVPLRGSVPLLLTVSFLFLVGTTGLGIWISCVAGNQFLANQLAFLLTFLPAFLLSGFMFPIANMPAVLQFVTWFIPAKYYIIILRGIYMKGVGFEVLWPDVLFLFCFTVLILGLARKSLVKKVA